MQCKLRSSYFSGMKRGKQKTYFPASKVTLCATMNNFFTDFVEDLQEAFRESTATLHRRV